MNRLLTSRATTVLKSTQWATQVRLNTTDATKKMVQVSHPTAPLSAFNQRLALQFRRNKEPKKLLENVLKTVEEIKQQNLKFDRNTYSSILAAYARNRDQESLFKTLKEMEENDLAPSVDNYNTVLEGLGRMGRYKSQLELKQEMLNKGVELTFSSYFNIMKGYCTAKQLDGALATLNEMKEKKLDVNLATYATLIDACTVVNDARTAFDLLKEAEQAGFPMDSRPRVYMDVMYVGAYNDELDIVEYCWEKALKTFSMRPDEGTLLQVLRVAAKKGNTTLATDTIRQLSTSGYPYKEHYFTPLMEAFIVKGDFKSAFNVLDIMRVSGITPNMRTAIPILKKLGTNVEAIDKAYFILEEMKKENKTIDVIAFNAIVGACANSKDLERTIATYREAKSLGITPNVDTYNAVLDACIKTRMKGMGNVVIEEMKKAEVSPNLDTYSRMISLSCTQKNYEDAFTYLEEMKSYDIVPPENCYINLAQKLAHEKDPRFHMVLEEMETFGYRIPRRVRELWSARN